LFISILILYVSPATANADGSADQCTCDPRSMKTNNVDSWLYNNQTGEFLLLTPLGDTTDSVGGWIVLKPSADGCSMDVMCLSVIPVSFGFYRFKHIDGNAPIVDMDDAASLKTINPDPKRNLVHQGMRCVTGNWIPYFGDIYDLTDNKYHPNEPDNWIAYNNIFCTKRPLLVESSMDGNVTSSTPQSTVFAKVRTTSKSKSTTSKPNGQNCENGFLTVNEYMEVLALNEGTFGGIFISESSCRELCSKLRFE
ncbi:hypothetical protein PMAYCL1PPCAC_00386, partial [Pristionchus mayeri]